MHWCFPPLLRTLFLGVTLLFLCHSPAFTQTHALSKHGDVKYSKDAPFDYVNIHAPKGGTLILPVVGTFNTLNPFALKGDAPAGLSLFSETLVFERLMVRSKDEPMTLYAHIAKGAKVAPNHAWIIFDVDQRARWADGKPITADDVIFSHHILSTQGKPVLQLLYGKVSKVEKLSPMQVKFHFKPLPTGTYDREMPMILGLMSILPKHALEGKDFASCSMENIPGSGPYAIHHVDWGKKIVYKRRADHWAASFPKQQGFYNFDTIEYLYFFEGHLPLEAFKAGLIHFIRETDPIAWQKNYHFTEKRRKEICLKTQANVMPMGMQGIVLNTRRPLFQDIRVRRALHLLFDYEPINKSFYAGQYKVYESFFDNSDLACHKILTPEDKRILLSVAPGILEKITPMEETRHLSPRQRLRKALALLKETGWSLDNRGIMRHQETGQRMTFNLILYSNMLQRTALYFKDSLKRAGIHVDVKVVDPSHYEKRLISHQFDSIINLWGQSHSPGADQKNYWTSEAAQIHGRRNHAGIQEEAIDQCCDLILTAKDRPTLKALVHGLDHLLLQGYYVIPLGYSGFTYMAHDRRFKHPPFKEGVPCPITTWWFDPKAKED